MLAINQRGLKGDPPSKTKNWETKISPFNQGLRQVPEVTRDFPSSQINYFLPIWPS